jgi:formylglycine-generating enzyme required for sulfatase activity
MDRRDFVRTAGFAMLARGAGTAQAEQDHPPLIPAPDHSGQWPAFRDALAAWRKETVRTFGYNDALYRRRDFAWVPRSFACCFLMLCDETFYLRDQNRYSVESWLDGGIREFGGYDSVVLWHAYPRIGLDLRNQFDFYRDMPGGLKGLRQLTAAFQVRGVKVYVDYNPWDTGTAREEMSDLDALLALIRSLGADGIFLDTMQKGAAEFRAKLDAVRPGVVLEGEGALPLENLHDHHLSWAQGFRDSRVPGVLRNKWVERRHMQHQIRRWHHDHTAELHTAWMNGSGMMVWENVFGSWAGWCARDRSILRSMLPIQRRYHSIFSGEGWIPLAPAESQDVYASLWEAGAVRLWTLVNRSGEERRGRVLKVAERPGSRYFDLVRGREAEADTGNGWIALVTSIGPRGIACFLSAPEAALGRDFRQFLAAQAATDARADFSGIFPSRRTALKPAPKQEPAATAAPAGMAAIGPAEFEFVVDYRLRETGFYTSEDYEPERGFRIHKPASTQPRAVRLGRYAIDLTPVTNAQFADFLGQSGYRPRHGENFLRHWRNGRPPSGKEEHPVVWVDLDDARAYARWAGKRLPAEEEWQYAAQGPEARRYPWGNEMKPGACNSGESGGTTAVTAFPAGRSAFGCYDMSGNTWEWTESERSDGRTRFCIIRSGSWFRARGSDWYMDGGPQPCSFGAKFLLMWPGLDRCETVGFRCAADLA